MIRWLQRAARDEILACSGSISHHHGVGKLRRQWIPATVGDVGLSVMKAIKSQLDPNNTFASGNIFTANILWISFWLLIHRFVQLAEMIHFKSSVVMVMLNEYNENFLSSTPHKWDSPVNGTLSQDLFSANVLCFLHIRKFLFGTLEISTIFWLRY
jgi:hypothetical protein